VLNFCDQFESCFGDDYCNAGAAAAVVGVDYEIHHCCHWKTAAVVAFGEEMSAAAAVVLGV